MPLLFLARALSFTVCYHNISAHITSVSPILQMILYITTFYLGFQVSFLGLRLSDKCNFIFTSNILCRFIM